MSSARASSSPSGSAPSPANQQRGGRLLLGWVPSARKACFAAVLTKWSSTGLWFWKRFFPEEGRLCIISGTTNSVCTARITSCVLLMLCCSFCCEGWKVRIAAHTLFCSRKIWLISHKQSRRCKQRLRHSLKLHGRADKTIHETRHRLDPELH